MSDSANQTARRTARATAVQALNDIARTCGLESIPSRASGPQFEQLWASVCSQSTAAVAPQLVAIRAGWVDNGGGGDVPEDSIPRTATQADVGASAVDEEIASDFVEFHRILRQSFYGTGSRKQFRFKSKAFLLTFNAAKFTEGSVVLWQAFLLWVRKRVAESHATFWSAAMERSLHSTLAGRIHLHVYFSWHGPGAQGVDQTTTDAWVFDGVRPRVDVNTENRGAFHWLRATQRGHFYCSVHKEGAVHTETNYPPWRLWAPEASWVVSLWKQHKLSHDAYRQLSVKLRDGHDRRKACVDAVEIAERSAAFAQERTWAREQLRMKALPFKPLPWQIEAWMMRYEELEERYPMLVLYGPSQTGKSRLARSLFGVERTLVVDVQNAQHPDLHAYRRGGHKAILLDEVKDPSFIVNNKKLLQAHVDGAILGQSATQMFTYEIFLWRTPIILTTNKWSLEKFDKADLNWIEANCVPVYIGEPVYETSKTSSPKASQLEVPTLRRPGPAMTPGLSPPHKRLASSSLCPACGDPLPCTCTTESKVVLPELPGY
jgi:hypothetical protein